MLQHLQKIYGSRRRTLRPVTSTTYLRLLKAGLLNDTYMHNSVVIRIRGLEDVLM
jgi:hypothetical protein